ncbi:MAG: 4'-phosphopantetheinyl transferase superfamily protein [Cellvibrionaceae bacterium]|nr:4'-phosphopantetheinyl transferase superfamily protein [Cellvibrionaceae bacterium]
MATLETYLQAPCHWVCRASVTQINAEDKLHWLSPAERRRADRFRVEAPRKSYILAHALKRYCLSRYLRQPPQALCFSLGDKGKPRCDHPQAPYFNISHADDCVVLGLSSFAEVGVDVEAIDRQVSPGLFSQVLSATQQQQLASAADPQQMFMVFWTQKEAISKSLGLGLSMDFAAIECTGTEGNSLSAAADPPLFLQTLLLDARFACSMASAVSRHFELYSICRWVAETIELSAD